MLIDNTLTKIIGIPLQKGPAVAGEAVRYLMMRPGVNKVSEADYQIAKEHDDFKSRIAKKQFVQIETKGKDNFTAITNKDELERLVQRTADEELLIEMLESDNRREFKKLVQKQLKALELPPALEA